MNPAPVAQTTKSSLTMLACLAWVVLLNCAHAAPDIQPLGDDVPFTLATEQVQQTSASLSTEAADADVTGLPEAPTPGESMPGAPMIVDDVAWPQPMVATPVAASPQQTATSSVWRYVPHGMIPYIGPRTPDSMKDVGFGQPLPLGAGWRSQPFSITAFIGGTNGGPLIAGHVNQRPSVYGGLNFGWDYDHYWGIEKRLGFGGLNLTDGAGQTISKTGMSVTGEYRVMYYPLGDTRWRPFFTGGVGWSDFYFNDDRGASHLDTVGMIPFGLGVKYLHTQRIAFRMDLIDEYTIGSGTLSNFHYVALTAGLEYRYGHRLLHMPWHHKDGS